MLNCLTILSLNRSNPFRPSTSPFSQSYTCQVHVWSPSKQCPQVFSPLLYKVASFPCAPSYYGPSLEELHMASRIQAPLQTATPPYGCHATSYSAARDSIVLVKRGQCLFEVKSQRASDAGAVANLIVLQEAGPVFMASGKHGDVRSRDSSIVPSFMVEHRVEEYVQAHEVSSVEVQVSRTRMGTGVHATHNKDVLTILVDEDFLVVVDRGTKANSFQLNMHALTQAQKDKLTSSIKVEAAKLK